MVQTPRAVNAPITPHPPALESFPFADNVEQAMTRLNQAAQLMSEVEPSGRRLRRSSRLAPIRDISADIRRESTPLPKFAKMRRNTGASAEVSASGQLSAQQEAGAEHDQQNESDLPDLWPWFDSEIEEKENEDSWANSTDPLISRRVPNSVEAARIEEEDIKRALAEGMPTSHDLRLVRPRRVFSLRLAFAVLALLAVVALIVDSVLLSVVVTHPRRATTLPNGPAVPTLTLFPNMVNVSQTSQRVQLHIVNFPAGHIQLTHDVQEAVTTTDRSSVVSIGKNGSANVTLIVDNTWPIGFDQVYAEDVATHYTASAQLQVAGGAPSKPAHLDILDQNGTLDFGRVVQGANSILPLTLKNTGTGSGPITWSAGSDQPWLLVSPGQGMFSQSQQIDVAVQTINLKPGMHTGTLTFSSNVNAQPQLVKVMLIVSQPGQGPVLAPTPAVLSFTTTDDSLTSPSPQTLTLNNPGNQPLNWSLTINASITASNQTALAHIPGVNNKWLSANQTSGALAPQSYQQIAISVNSNSLLPGAYRGQLVFNAPGAIDPVQKVAVSLTVQPHCGLVTSSGFLSFTAVQGKTNPSNQSLGLNATASCAAGTAINWTATLSSAGWLSMTPTAGTLAGTTSQFVSVGVSATALPANTYFGFIAFTTKHSTQTVMIELKVQPPPPPGAPVMSAAPLNLNFSSTQGQPNPKGQVVTITNSGGSQLKWSTAVNPITGCWLCVSPSGGTIAQGSTGQLVVSVNTSHLTPGTYAGQVILTGTDNNNKPASGSGQIVSINLVVQPPCTLTQPSASSLAFSGVQGPFNPISQSLLITGTGNCAWPLTLTLGSSSAPWLSAQFPNDNKINSNGQSIPFVVSANIAGLTSGPPISASFTISATDSAGNIAYGSPQTISATLTVAPPCLPVVPAPLNFSTVQGTSPMPQTVTLKEMNSCSLPISWTATADANSSAWLSLSAPPQDTTGNGSPLTVTINSAGLTANNYKGTITVTATDGNGNAVGTPQTIAVTLTVTPPPTYTVTGTVMACAGPAPNCTPSAALPGASLILFNGTTQVTTITADSSGNFTFTNLPAGNYTVTITGTDSNNTHYSTANIPLVVTTNASSVILQVFPG